MNADLIAFQEMETFEGGAFSFRNLQLDWILENLPAYAPAAAGNPEKYPGTQPILYRKGAFDVERQGFFFFSEEPDRSSRSGECSTMVYGRQTTIPSASRRVSAKTDEPLQPT